MNVGFHNKKGTPPEIEDNIFTFSCAKPVIIQSSEIKRVLTDVTLEIDPGFVLTIVSASNIYEKAAEIFPGPFVLDHKTPKKVLEIPIRNHAGAPLHLMEGEIIGRGYLTQIAEVQIKEIEPIETGRQKMKRSQPQKKNTDIKFEVK